MTLQLQVDHSVADWFLHDGQSDDDLWATVVQGPAGFEAYATVHFDRDDDPEFRSDTTIVELLTSVAADFTSTPDVAYFGLWDGWGQMAGPGERHSTMPTTNWLSWIYRPAKVRPETSPFHPDVLASPRLSIESWRDYLLFTGPLSQVGEYPARPPAPDWPVSLPPASLTWPQDRAWFITSDVDPSWCCVAGSQALVDAVIAHPDLRAEAASRGVIPPLDAGDTGLGGEAS